MVARININKNSANVEDKLLKLLLDIKKRVKFYKYVIPDEINKPDEIYEILKKIPFVDKGYIKSNISDFINQDLLCEDLYGLLDIKKDFYKEYSCTIKGQTVVAEYTSGTTGVPFASLKTLNERVRLGKSLWRARNKYEPVTPQELFMHVHTNDRMFPFDDIGDRETDILNELKYLCQISYTWWHIYPSLLKTYYEYLKKYNMRISSLNVIEYNGAYISKTDHLKYERFFNCKLANNYGCREVWNIAYDCPLNYLHINNDSIYFELIDENKEIINEPNKLGYIVVTSLYQKTMPFIRYNTGDMASYVEGECLCGDKSRRIILNPGRELIIGTQLHGNRVFKEIIAGLNQNFSMTNFHSVSIRQKDICTFQINFRLNKENKEELEQSFLLSANKVLNDDYNYVFTYHDDLREKSFFVTSNKK